MNEASRQWEGQIVDGIFPLRQYLGGSDHSAVFLTENNDGGAQKAAIKLYPADPATADLQVAQWETAAQLSHPHLLRLFHAGRSRLGGEDLLYLVMEYAEENLSEILPLRALTAAETRDMLGPVLEALEYLHGKGFLHGDLKPANILASADHLKVSSDTISRIGERQSYSRKPGVYDPPEAISGVLTPAADVWSLGTTLVEVLTQRLPEWQPGPNREPVVPTTLAAPFQEIARQCLRLEPPRRINIAGLGALLNSRATAATAAASAAAPGSSTTASAPVPVSAPAASLATPDLGPTPSVRPAAVAEQRPPMPPPRPKPSLPIPTMPVAKRQGSPHRPPPDQQTGGRPRFLVPLIAGALLFAAILTVPRLLTRRPESQPVSTVSAEKPPSEAVVQKPAESGSESGLASAKTTKSAPLAAPKIEQKGAQPDAPESLKQTSEKEEPVPTSSASSTPAVAEAPKSAVARVNSSKGEVLDQVLPDVSAKARATIHGRVRVSVKVHVDPSGGVSGAEFESEGPSQFFADLALQASRKWAFTPPEVNGRSVSSDWRLRFVFTQNNTKVTPEQLAP